MFRFTIRESLLVILAIAMGLGWWSDHVRGYQRAKPHPWNEALRQSLPM
jgi:hypothetical protein